MSNDKNLADVQPGGAVRLGEQAERARFEAWHCEKFKTRRQSGAPTRDIHNGVWADQYGPAEQQARWELWQAAWQAAFAARQPAGQEPVAVVGHDLTLHWTGTGSIAPLLKRHGIGPGSKLYAIPPVQAVDLGAVRSLLRRRIEQWRSHLPDDPGAPGTREIETKGEHDYNNDVRIYSEGIAVMQQVLALIDSQAVGNG